MEAKVMLAKCPKRNRVYGIRTQNTSDRDWYCTWAFPVNENKASNEGYDITEVKGSLYYAEGYPGCPYCGKGFVQCNRCRKLSCHAAEEQQLVCTWCGNLMNNFVTGGTFDVSGGDI